MPWSLIFAKSMPEAMQWRRTCGNNVLWPIKLHGRTGMLVRPQSIATHQWNHPVPDRLRLIGFKVASEVDRGLQGPKDGST